MVFFAAQQFAHEYINSSRHPLRVGFDQLGLYVEAVETYRVAISTTDHTMNDEAGFDYALIHNAAALENLVAVYAPRPLAEVLTATRIVCLNEAAGTAARAHGLNVHLRASENSARALARLLRDDCLQRR